MGHHRTNRRCKNAGNDIVAIINDNVQDGPLHSKPSLHSETQSIVYGRVHDEQSHFMVELGSSPSAHIDLKMNIYDF